MADKNNTIIDGESVLLPLFIMFTNFILNAY